MDEKEKCIFCNTELKTIVYDSARKKLLHYITYCPSCKKIKDKKFYSKDFYIDYYEVIEVEVKDSDMPF